MERWGAVVAIVLAGLVWAWLRRRGRTPTPACDGTHTLVLAVRKDLKMGAGKLGAQCGHAVQGALEQMSNKNPAYRAWAEGGCRKICLKLANLGELRAIRAHAKLQDLPTYTVCDAGHTQVAAGTATVLAIGPASRTAVDVVTQNLSLY